MNYSLRRTELGYRARVVLEMGRYVGTAQIEGTTCSKTTEAIRSAVGKLEAVRPDSGKAVVDFYA